MKKPFYKRPLFFILIAAILFAAAGAIFYFSGGQKTNYEFATVKRGDLVKEVSVTGRVKPAQEVALAFERSGKVASTPVKVGEEVSAGEILATLENADLMAQVAQARATLASNQAKLEQLRRGTRAEELQVAQTAVTNAENSLADAKSNLAIIKSQAEASLAQVYDGSLTAASKSIAAGLNSLYVLTDIQYSHFAGTDANGATIDYTKAAAVKALLGADNAGRWTNSGLSQLNGGAKATVQAAQSDPTRENIDKALSETLAALQHLKTALEIVPITTDLTATERTNLATEKTSINTEITTISGKQETIRVQKSTNDYNISTAQTSVTTALNTLATAKDQLALKVAGTAPEEIKSQEALVRSAQASLDSAQAQLAKTIIYSPIAGVVTKQDAKIGEIITQNAALISLISASQFQIEANIPETDIAKVRAGNLAKLTLDTYGNEAFFSATVISVDPAEKILEGVATYKTILEFNQQDERVKSGMTANLEISVDQRTNALFVPQRAVATKTSGDKTARILAADGKTVTEVKVETGLRASDGNIEIVAGLSEGQQVIISTES